MYRNRVVVCLALCLAAACLPFASQAQGRKGASSLAKLRGVVRTATGGPAAGIQVTVMPEARSDVEINWRLLQAVTGPDGSYTIQAPKVARYQIFWEKTAKYRSGSLALTRSGTNLSAAIAKIRDMNSPEFAGGICRSRATQCGEIAGFCIDPAGHFIVCDKKARALLCVSHDDRLISTTPVPFACEAVCVMPDGSYLVGGGRDVAIVTPTGKVVARSTVEARMGITAVAQAGGYVFACADNNSGYAVTRMSAALANPTRIITGLSGCCGQMDVQAHNGALYVAHNGRFSVDKYDLEGKLVRSARHEDASKADYYGEGCCEPKNLAFGPDGSLYTSASGKMQVKRYSEDGKFTGRQWSLPNPDGSCVRVTVGVTPSGSVYILDTENNVIRLAKAIARK